MYKGIQVWNSDFKVISKQKDYSYSFCHGFTAQVGTVITCTTC